MLEDQRLKEDNADRSPKEPAQASPSESPFLPSESLPSPHYPGTLGPSVPHIALHTHTRQPTDTGADPNANLEYAAPISTTSPHPPDSPETGLTTSIQHISSDDIRHPSPPMPILAARANLADSGSSDPTRLSPSSTPKQHLRFSPQDGYGEAYWTPRTRESRMSVYSPMRSSNNMTDPLIISIQHLEPEEEDPALQQQSLDDAPQEEVNWFGEPISQLSSPSMTSSVDTLSSNSASTLQFSSSSASLPSVGSDDTVSKKEVKKAAKKEKEEAKALRKREKSVAKLQRELIELERRRLSCGTSASLPADSSPTPLSQSLKLPLPGDSKQIDFSNSASSTGPIEPCPPPPSHTSIGSRSSSDPTTARYTQQQQQQQPRNTQTSARTSVWRVAVPSFTHAYSSDKPDDSSLSPASPASPEPALAMASKEGKLTASPPSSIELMMSDWVHL